MPEGYNANGILQPKLALEEPTLRVLVGLAEDIKNILSSGYRFPK